jgi:hypothetical protein
MPLSAGSWVFAPQRAAESRNNQKDKEYEKQDLSDARRSPCDPGKTEQAGDQGKNEKSDGPL